MVMRLTANQFNAGSTPVAVSNSKGDTNVKIIGWITIYLEGSAVAEYSPVYDMKEWINDRSK